MGLHLTCIISSLPYAFWLSHAKLVSRPPLKTNGSFAPKVFQSISSMHQFSKCIPSLLWYHPVCLSLLASICEEHSTRVRIMACLELVLNKFKRGSAAGYTEQKNELSIDRDIPKVHQSWDLFFLREKARSGSEHDKERKITLSRYRNKIVTQSKRIDLTLWNIR